MKQQNVRKRITDQYRDAGFDKQQAVKMADPLVELHENMVTKDDLKAELAATKDDLKAELAATKDDLKAELAATKDDLKAELAATKDDLTVELAATRADFDVKLAATRTDFDVKLAEAIAPLATKAEMKVGFAELRTEMADLRTEVSDKLHRQTWLLLTAIGVGVAVISVVISTVAS